MKMETIESVLDRVPPGDYTMDEFIAVAGLDWPRPIVGRELMASRHLRSLEVIKRGARKIFRILANVKVSAPARKEGE